MHHQQIPTPVQAAQPLVTFIVTYYNLPVQMLCECVDSILALSLSESEREIIIIDDGSEVSPMNALMKYGDDIVYIRQHHQGVSVARNTALHMAKGAFIQIVDGDDVLIKEPYEQCLDIARSHPDAEIIVFDFSTTPTMVTVSKDDVKQLSGVAYLSNHNIQGCIWCKLFRQSVRSQLEFTPGICYGEDEEFTPQLILRAEVVYLTPYKAYYYRQHEASAIHQTDAAHIAMRLDQNLIVIRHLNQLSDRLPAADKPGMQRRVAQLTMDYLYNTIMLTRSGSALSRRIEELTAEGLFPLPDKDYSAKYTWFRRIVNSEKGRRFLLITLPHLKRER
jgi:glycosyltransferase involved in cell wall biosynthesis